MALGYPPIRWGRRWWKSSRFAIKQPAIMTTIRTAREEDLPAILGIYNHIILNTAAVYHYQAHTMEMRKAWYDARIQEGFPVFVAESEGKVVGFSSYGLFRPWPAYKYTVENSVYVADGQ